jgi:trimeric autotransporter adhesin
MIALAFGAIAAGAVALVAGLTGSSIRSVVKGHPDHSVGSPELAGVEGSSSPAQPAPAQSSQSSTSSSSWRAVLRDESRRRGWSAADWEGVVKLESGGNPAAVNPSSGAFGLGQFLGSTLAEYAPYGATSKNPVKQIRAMGKYIADRYGTPTKALEHEHAYGWY